METGSRTPLGSSCVRGNDSARFPVGDIFLNPLQHCRLSVQVINRDIEESLVKHIKKLKTAQLEPGTDMFYRVYLFP